MNRDCKTFSYRLKSATTATLRCKIEYYKLPASLRQCDWIIIPPFPSVDLAQAG